MRLLGTLGGLMLLLAAGCGGSDSDSASSTKGETVVPDWLGARLAEKKGEDVALIFGTSDYAAGENRITFLVVRGNGQVVLAPSAPLLVVPEGAEEGVVTTARATPVGPGAGEPVADGETTELMVAQADLSKPGRYWLLAELDGKSVQGYGMVDVREQTKSPSVGAKAIRSNNPTLADAPATEISTAKPPRPELLRHTVNDSVRKGVPFVVVFATPAFCESRTCGPAVEVADVVRRRFAARGIRFIHIEIYEDNVPAKGVNRWVKEWKLPTEPWVFVVDRGGVIRAKFEGSVSVPELEGAVRRHLL